MTGPIRETVEGRVYLDLQNRARKEGRPTDELLQLFTLEGFLARLAASYRRTQFVLKGGVLLAAFGTRRPTRDIDLQAQQLSNDADAMLEIVREVAAIDLDGLSFDTVSARAAVIRDDAEYAGASVSMSVTLSQARMMAGPLHGTGRRTTLEDVQDEDRCTGVALDHRGCSGPEVLVLSREWPAHSRQLRRGLPHQDRPEVLHP